MSITSFFNKMPKTEAPSFIMWKATVRTPGSTALRDVDLKARPGSFVTHSVHGKVKLISQPEPDKLVVEVTTASLDTFLSQGPTITRETVNASDCTNPQAVAQSFHESVYLDNEDWQVYDEASLRYGSALRDAAVKKGYRSTCVPLERKPPKPPGTGKGKGKATALGATAQPKTKGGRPKGSTDKKPRAKRGKKRVVVSWEYAGGNDAPRSYQVAAVRARRNRGRPFIRRGRRLRH